MAPFHTAAEEIAAALRLNAITITSTELAVFLDAVTGGRSGAWRREIGCSTWACGTLDRCIYGLIICGALLRRRPSAVHGVHLTATCVETVAPSKDPSRLPIHCIAGACINFDSFASCVHALSIQHRCVGCVVWYMLRGTRSLGAASGFRDAT